MYAKRERALTVPDKLRRVKRGPLILKAVLTLAAGNTFCSFTFLGRYLDSILTRQNPLQAVNDQCSR